MATLFDPEQFRLPAELADHLRGKRVLITGAGKHNGLGQAFALAAGLAGAHVAVHFHASYEDGLQTVEMIERAGGRAFPVQADVTNLADVWTMRSYVLRKFGDLPPDVLICNSGLAERGYLLGRPATPVEGESPAMRRARVRKAFVDNLTESRAVIDTKLDGFLAMTHLWAGEAIDRKQHLTIIYISSRQALDPGAGVPGYVAANWGVLVYPDMLAINLGKNAPLVSAACVALPFVRTAMTESYASSPKVFARWQSRMLEGHEAARALVQLLARPREDLDRRLFQLDVDGPADDLRVGWSEVVLQRQVTPVTWSAADPLHLGPETPEVDKGWAAGGGALAR